MTFDRSGISWESLKLTMLGCFMPRSLFRLFRASPSFTSSVFGIMARNTDTLAPSAFIFASCKVHQFQAVPLSSPRVNGRDEPVTKLVSFANIVPALRLRSLCVLRGGRPCGFVDLLAIFWPSETHSGGEG